MKSITELRNIEVELDRFRTRTIAAAAVVLVAFGLLTFRWVVLQVVRHDDLAAQAEANRIGVVPIVPNRGLIVDRNGVVMATNYPAYTLLSYLAISMHRRLLWFSLAEQALQILPVFIVAHAVSLVVRLLSSGSFPGWTLILAPLFEALLWPVVSWLLLAPQRRAPDRDENRPL